MQATGSLCSTVRGIGPVSESSTIAWRRRRPQFGTVGCSSETGGLCCARGRQVPQNGETLGEKTTDGVACAASASRRFLGDEVGTTTTMRKPLLICSSRRSAQDAKLST